MTTLVIAFVLIAVYTVSRALVYPPASGLPVVHMPSLQSVTATLEKHRWNCFPVSDHYAECSDGKQTIKASTVVRARAKAPDDHSNNVTLLEVSSGTEDQIDILSLLGYPRNILEDFLSSEKRFYLTSENIAFVKGDDGSVTIFDADPTIPALDEIRQRLYTLQMEVQPAAGMKQSDSTTWLRARMSGASDPSCVTDVWLNNSSNIDVWYRVKNHFLQQFPVNGQEMYAFFKTGYVERSEHRNQTMTSFCPYGARMYILSERQTTDLQADSMLEVTILESSKLATRSVSAVSHYFSTSHTLNMRTDLFSSNTLAITAIAQDDEREHWTVYRISPSIGQGDDEWYLMEDCELYRQTDLYCKKRYLP